MADLRPDYNKRESSLPSGCNDLLEMLNLPEEIVISSPQTTDRMQIPSKPLEIAEAITVKKLAALLGCPPYKVMATLVSLNTFVRNDECQLVLEVAVEVAKRHGCKV